MDTEKLLNQLVTESAKYDSLWLQDVDARAVGLNSDRPTSVDPLTEVAFRNNRDGHADFRRGSAQLF